MNEQEMEMELETAATNLHNAKVASNKAKDKVIECEEVFISLVNCPEKGSKTVKAGDHFKVTVKRGFNYKVDKDDIDKIAAIDKDMIKSKGRELNVKEYESLRNEDPEEFKLVAKYVTVTPSKTSVTTKAI